MTHRARLIPLLLTTLCAATACTSPAPEPADEVGTAAQEEKWGFNDHPNRFASDLVYELADLPLEGEAARIPWPGSYWPTYRDSINDRWEGADSASPAEKYGQAFDVQGVPDAVSEAFGIDSHSHRTECQQDDECDSDIGERCAKRRDQESGHCIPTWFGICHGWAPAAVLEPEPVEPVTVNGVTFRVNDIKALASIAYNSTQVRFLSYRCNTDDDDISFDEYQRPDTKCRDTNPGTFHVIATNFLGLRGESFAEDRTYDDEVWNQPMRGYRITQQEEITFQQANALVGATATGGETDDQTGTVAQAEWQHFGPYQVTEGTQFRAAIVGDGDADLYVRFGAQPTAEDYDCRPYHAGSSEICEHTIAAGVSQAFVSVHGYEPTSTFELAVTYDATTPGEYVFNEDAVAFHHVKLTAEYISESASTTDGNLAGSIDSYTHQDHYEYVLELDDQGRIVGGEWIGASKRNHPDFLWLPIEVGQATQASGTIRYADIKSLIDQSVAGSNPGPEPVVVTEQGSVDKDQWVHFGPFEVGDGALEAVLSGTGDADLYVRKGAEPTAGDYDCRPYQSGSDEECAVDGPAVVYVSVHGYESSEFTLNVTYTPTPSEPETEEISVTESGTVGADQWVHYGPFDVADGALDAVLTGTGDADLYVRQGAQPTAATYDCRPYVASSDEECSVDGPGEIYVSVQGYASSSTFELTVSYTGSSG